MFEVVELVLLKQERDRLRREWHISKDLNALLALAHVGQRIHELEDSPDTTEERKLGQELDDGTSQ